METKYVLAIVAIAITGSLLMQYLIAGYNTHNEKKRKRQEHIRELQSLPKSTLILQQKDMPVIKEIKPLETFEATYYSAYCPTCGKWGGITATGHDISDKITHEGRGIIAVDPRVIPLYSIVEVDGKEYIALDTGGDIKGKRIDILVNSTKEAYRLGRHDVKVRIIES